MLALAILGMPVNMLPLEVIRCIMEGETEVCREAGVALAGGHSMARDSLRLPVRASAVEALAAG